MSDSDIASEIQQLYQLILEGQREDEKFKASLLDKLDIIIDSLNRINGSLDEANNSNPIIIEERQEQRRRDLDI